ncbi:MAG: T9SS type A sorting domain-containing protein, partial [candidate division KSB1 bacterium]|nr:T9SS type A sorting domain-containing protein [candidate division KSB1 bacterium]
LTDLRTGTYQGYAGGLYPNGSNFLPGAHKAAGLLAAAQIRPLNQAGSVDFLNGKIGLIAIGPSFATMEFSAFKILVAHDPTVNPELVLVDGAQSGKSASQFADTTDQVWTVIAQRLADANVTRQQVQVAWVKSVNTIHNAGFPADQTKLANDLAQIARNLKAKFPNIKLAYFTSRSYGGYGNNEPYPYETGFAVKWLIERQINADTTLRFVGANAKAPWLAWAPYLWADGTTPRQDGVTWECSDYQDDGVHPSLSGRAKVARMLLTFFKTDSTASSWFLRNPPTAVEETPHFSPSGFVLERNYPNPFNPATVINFQLPVDSYMTLKVFDVSGREVATLVNGQLEAGKHNVVFKAGHLPSGVYFIRLTAGQFTQIRKAALIK